VVFVRYSRRFSIANIKQYKEQEPGPRREFSDARRRREQEVYQRCQEDDAESQART
jgi:hypothetical protein